MKRLNVALVAGTMEMYPGVAESLYSEHQKDLLDLSKELDFNLKIYKELLTTEKRAKGVRKDIDSNDIDFILIFHPTYISGDIIFELMKTKANIGLWAIEEPDEEGPISLTSFVCLMQNTAIAGHCFKKEKKKFKWFFGSRKGKYFKSRFEITIKALTAVKNIKNSKVAQIGEIAGGHRDSYYDERTIYENLGVEVVRGIEIEDIIDKAKKITGKAVDKEVENIVSSCSKIGVDDSKIINSVKTFLAVKKICDEEGFQAVGFSCWPKIWEFDNLAACLSNSLLNSIGVPAACEGDVLSAISMLVMKYISGEPTALMDFPRFDDSDDSLLLWHCGSAPVEMAGKRGVSCDPHFRGAFEDKGEFADLAPVTDMVFKESDITVFRLSGEGDEFYYFTGRTFDGGKKSWVGSRGWVKDLKFYNEKIKVIDLVNTIFLNSIHHHFPIVLKDISKYLKEFAYWMDLKKIARIDYDDSMDVY
jgi:hypothetical protein